MPYTESDLEMAMEEAQLRSNSLRNIAEKYDVPFSTLRDRLQKTPFAEQKLRRGRRTALGKTLEMHLAESIRVLCNNGFCPRQEELLTLVQEYLTTYKIKTPFKDNRPGWHWLMSFMRRNNLSMKKANLLNSAKQSASSNPFIVYDFYDTLEKLMLEHNFEPNQIWNVYESEFSTDPTRGRFVKSAGRQSISVLAACCADGSSQAPFITYQGKNLQITWCGKKALPGTSYAVSKNGWMTTEIFFDWFKKFLQKVLSRPLLMLFDGHLSFLPMELIELARENDIFLLKFPPHKTDGFQLMDVSCFGPLKRRWENVLCDWVDKRKSNKPIRRSDFVDQLCAIWNLGLSKENVLTGFQATGIYPCDRNKYPFDCFDAKMLRRYVLWYEVGMPDDITEDLATCTVRYKKTHVTSAEAEEEIFAKEPTTSCMLCRCDELGPKPHPIEGKEWFPAWVLREAATPSSSAASSTADTSFKELLPEKVKRPTPKVSRKRRKINL